MGANQIKEKIYFSIESSNLDQLAYLLKEYPEYLNSPITDDCQNTPLTRSVWRDDRKLVELLLGMGCKVNQTGPKGISPLMWAAKRGHIKMAQYLLENGADLLQKSEDQNQFTALEMAIVNGQYQMSLFLLEKNESQAQNIKHWEVYKEAAQGKYLSYVNYEEFIVYLKQKVPFKDCPNFFKRPDPPKLRDPVIDPRESWTDFFKRNIDFKEPPLVERNELDVKMQPQNRFWAKIRHYVNGLNPHPKENNENNRQYQEPDNENLQKQSQRK